MYVCDVSDVYDVSGAYDVNDVCVVCCRIRPVCVRCILIQLYEKLFLVYFSNYRVLPGQIKHFFFDKNH